MSRTLRAFIITIAVLIGGALVTPASRAESRGNAPRAAGSLLVAFKPTAPLAARAARVSRFGLEVDPRFFCAHAARLRLGAEARRLGVTLPSVLAALRSDPTVRHAEPDYPIHVESIPNDPRFPQQWALRNTGQSGGTPGADIDAPTAWDSTTGSASVVVGVIDTGVDYTHDDLKANIMRGPGGVVAGYDFVNEDADPMDDQSDSHGTHVAGIIGARGNNALGVTGAAQSVRIMPIKILDSAGNGLTSDIIRAVDFAIANGAQVLNNSYGGDEFSQFVQEAIQRASDAGILFVAAAGNSHSNNDLKPVYPACHNSACPNVIAVAATNPVDDLASISNFGAKSVDIAAPGTAILSTIRGNGYGTLTGTSMAAPLVSGAAALVLSRFPTVSPAQLKARLLGSADRLPSLTGRVAAGRLNAAGAVELDTTPPSRPSGLTATHRGETVLRLTWIAPGDDGSLGRATSYALRCSGAPITADNFDQAVAAPGVPIPAPAGTRESCLLTGLIPGQVLYLGLIAVDNAGNRSAVAAAGPFSTLTGTGATLLSDDAESGSKFFGSGAWNFTTEDRFSGIQSYTDSPGAPYANNANSPLTLTTPVLISGTSPVLTFHARTDLEQDHDFLYVEGSADGARWHRLLALTGASGWSTHTAFLAAFRGASLQLRFRLVTDGSVTGDGVWLDDISIRSQDVGVCLAEETVEGTPQFTGQSPWGVSTEDRFSGAHGYADSPGALYGANLDLPLVQNASVPLGETAAWLNFWARTNLEEGFDFLRVEASGDEGATWDALAAITGTQAAGFYTVPLSAYVGKSVLLRFRLATDAQGSADGVWLDDIRICGESMQAMAVPAAPSGFTARLKSESQADLSWVDNAVDETGYQIERRAGSGSYAVLASTPADATRYSDTGLQPSTTYTYRLSSFNSAGVATAGGEAGVTTPAIPIGKLKIARHLSFGTCVVGGRVEKTLWVQNLSRTDPLRVTLAAPGSPFFLSGSSLIVLAPRERRSMSFSFSPQTRGKAQVFLQVQSSDPKKPLIKVKLLGKGK